MVQHRCPHCGDDGISGLRKMFLGPANPATCSECGKKVGISYKWLFRGMVPWFVAFGLLPFANGSEFLGFGLGAFGVLGMVIVMEGFAPLIKR